MLRPALLLALVAALLAGLSLGASELRRARSAAAIAAGEAADRATRLEQAGRRIRELEAELARTLETQQRLNDLLAAQADDRVEAQIDRAEAARSALEPMSQQAAFVARLLQRCLNEDGYDNLRLLRAWRAGEQELLGVEFLEHDRDRASSVLYLAARMTVTLDRAGARLTLRFFDGSVVRGGERSPLPPQGLPLVLTDVIGEMWEAELPTLVAAEGAYPAPPQPVPRRGPSVELGIWRERLDVLLATAAQQRTWRMSRLGGIDPDGFTDVLLLSYEGRRLCGAVEASRLRVLVDRERDSASLELHDGLVFHSGGSTAIPPTGYRIPLPGVGARAASDRMLGFVRQDAR
jgi:hypothetical protein